MRSLRLLLLCLPAVLAGAVSAQGWQSDAFGLYRPGSDPQRDGWAGLRIGGDVQDTVVVEPGAAARLAFFAGPKSQPAGKDRVHLVALGFDAAGNLIADGTDVRVTTGDGRRALRLSSGGIADVLHDPEDTAASYHAGAETGSVQSARAMYRVVSDVASVRPAIVPPPMAASEGFAALSTGPLADAFGNALEDGVGLAVLLRDGRGTWTRLDAVTGGGVARATLLSREAEGSGSVKMALASTVSPAVPVRIRPLRPAGPLDAQVEVLADIGALRLTVGPFLTDAGHMLNDGTGVAITLPDGRAIETWVRDGMAELVLVARGGEIPALLAVQSTLGSQTAVPRIVAPRKSRGEMRE